MHLEDGVTVPRSVAQDNAWPDMAEDEGRKIYTSTVKSRYEEDGNKEQTVLKSRFAMPRFFLYISIVIIPD